MKLFIHVNSFEKSSVKLWPFCPGRDELKHVLLYLFEYFCFVQCFLHPRSAGMLKLGQRVGAFATRPWQRRRGSVALTGRRGTAKLQPGIRLQSARGTIVPGPGPQCWVWIGFGFELVLPGIMRPFSYPPALRAVLWHTRLWLQLWHWWLLYILNKLSIFHIILFESIML